MAERIARVGAEDKPEFEWEFALVDRPEANAFCLPGGKIVVFTGLLDVARTDDELATVIGHEVAHAVAEHGAERIFREQLTQRAVLAASGAFADDPQRFARVALLLGAGAHGGQRPPEHLSTHPSGRTRVQQIRAWLPEARGEAREA